MIHWKDLPYSIYPNPENACFSGSTLVEDDRVVAIYHGTEVGNIVAISSDPLLLNWEKLTGKAVIPAVDVDDKGDPYRVYDPCIWKDGEYYYSLSGSYREGRFRVDCRKVEYIFRSKDLIDWEFLGEFVENSPFGNSGDDGGCPYFWPIGNKYILLTFSHRNGPMYVIGDYDRKRQKLIAQNYGRLNTGTAWNGSIHAPSACPDGKGGVIAIYNITHGKDINKWDQIMSLPRNLNLSVDNQLLIEPAGDIASLREKPVNLNNITLPANKEVVFEQIDGNSMELVS